MKGACENERHPRGEATGRIVTAFTNGSYNREVVCPKCGRVQGVRLMRVGKGKP